MFATLIFEEVTQITLHNILQSLEADKLYPCESGLKYSQVSNQGISSGK